MTLFAIDFPCIVPYSGDRNQREDTMEAILSNLDSLMLWIGIFFTVLIVAVSLVGDGTESITPQSIAIAGLIFLGALSAHMIYG